MKNRVLGIAAALAGMGAAHASLSPTLDLDKIAGTPRSTMWPGLGPVQPSKRRVAMDKRDARKKRNRLRARGR